MKVLYQSASVRKTFRNQVNQKKAINRQAVQESLSNSSFAAFGTAVFEWNQIMNQFKGDIGEQGISVLLRSLPNTWVMFNNAVIPTNRLGTLTEIDHLLIGPGGVFLIEVKMWQGSFSAYKDNWKRRDRDNWVAINNSPTSQSAYHQKMFQQWIKLLSL